MSPLMENPIIKSLVETAGVNLKESETLQPVFFISANDTIGILPANFEDEDAKNESADAVRAVVEKMDADFVFFIAESWMASTKDMGNVNENRRLYGDSISKWPGSKEVVIFRYETPSTIWGGTADILPGRVMGEVQWNEMKRDEEKGRFTQFFREKRETN